MDSRSISGGVPADDVDVLDSRQQPVWHVVLLGFFTCGLYLPYWVFKTCRDLKRESAEVNGVEVDPAAAAAGIAPPTLPPIPARRKDIVLDEDTREALRIFGHQSPALRGVGAAIAVWNIYIVGILSAGICSLVPYPSSFPRQKPILATVAVIGTWTALLTLSFLPVPWFILSFLAMAPIGFVQHWLNQYWRNVESDSLLVRHGFNMWEMITIIAGASLTGLVVAGNMIGVKPH